jgi:hypothetical protein
VHTIHTGDIDVKHAAAGELVGACLLPADHRLRIVTTTRNQPDFYVAEHEHNRRRWFTTDATAAAP